MVTTAGDVVKEEEKHVVDEETDDVVGRGARGLPFLVALQAGSRALTFSLNVLVARQLSPGDFGVSAVQLHLVLNSVLFLSREATRRVCLRLKIEAPGDDDVAYLVNMAWMSVPLGCAFAACTAALFLRWHAMGVAAEGASGDGAEAMISATSGVAHYEVAVMMTAMAAVIELFSEPAFCILQGTLNFADRAAVELVAVLLRCICTYLLLWAGVGVVAFSGAQAVFALTMVVGLGTAVFRRTRAAATALSRRREQLKNLKQRRGDAGEDSDKGGTGREDGRDASNGKTLGWPLLSMGDLLPGRAPRSGKWVRGDMLSLAATLEAQSLWKFVAQEGEKVALMATSRLGDQGAYALVANLGSLAARFLFQPLEESLHAVFAKLAAGGGQDRSAALLATAVKLTATVGLVFAAFGPAYAHAALDILYTSRWSGTEAPALLGTYCWYVLTMAVNGVGESFVHAVASPAELVRFNWTMVVLTAVHMGTVAALASRHGSHGIVIANAVNMIFRIVQSAVFARRYFDPGFCPTLGSLAPSPPTLGAFAVAAIVVRWSANSVYQPPRLAATVAHIGIGVACLVGVGAVSYLTDHDFALRLRQLRTTVGHKSKTGDKSGIAGVDVGARVSSSKKDD